MIPIDRVLVPVDFSKESTLAAKFASSIAQEYKTKLYVLHVDEPAPSYFYLNPPEELLRVEYEQARMNQIKEDLSQVIPEAVKEIISVEEVLESGRPHHVIVEKAKELQVDVIVIATHGRTGLSHVLLGSVAEQVIRHAPCPVFVIRNPENKYVYGWE